MLNILKWMIICAFVVALILFGFIIGIVKNVAYKSTLKDAKKKYQYQMLTIGLFRKILPCIGYDRFIWSDWRPSEKRWRDNGYLLLWYQMENQSWILVDVGFWTSEVFACLLRLQRKREERTKILCNETNLILADVQSVLQRQIDKNNEDMLRAAKEQQLIIQRLSPMEMDYVKSKVEVDA